MALYIPAGRRRRRLYVAAALSVVVGLVVGLAIGRATAPTPQDQAAQAKQLAKAVTGQLEAFPIHYDQVAKGEIDKATFYASLSSGLQRARDDLGKATSDAAWLDDATKRKLDDDVQKVKALADQNAPAPQFDAAVKQAVADINAAFGAAVANTATS